MEKPYYTLAEASAHLGADAVTMGEHGVLPMAYRLPESSDTESTAYVIESGIKPGWVALAFLYITPEQFRKVVNADRKKDRAILRHTFKSLDDLANAPEIIEQRKAMDPVTRKLIESGVKMTHLYAALDDVYVTAEAMAAYEAAATSGAPEKAALPVPAFRPKVGWQIALFDSWLQICKTYSRIPTAPEAANWLKKNDESGTILNKAAGSGLWWKPQRGAAKEVPIKTIENVISAWKVSGVLPT